MQIESLSKDEPGTRCTGIKVIGNTKPGKGEIETQSAQEGRDISEEN
jgi:hypothetical protein